MILTITPNPLLDYVIQTPTPPTDGGHRVRSIDYTVGGKGINVARMLKTLGRPALAISFAGGPNGEKIRARLKEQGICAHLVPTAAETRAGINLVTETPPSQMWWIEDGEELEFGEVAAMLLAVRQHLPRARFVAMSGTIPGRKNLDLYQRILEECRLFPCEVYVDARGEALRCALRVGRFFLKCNRQEVIETWNYDPFAPEQRNCFVNDCRQAGLTGFMITDGPGDIIWSDLRMIGFLRPPPVREISAVGSGDAALAGLIHARSEGKPFSEAVRWAIAAGAADAGYAGPCQASWGDIHPLMPLVQELQVRKAD